MEPAQAVPPILDRTQIPGEARQERCHRRTIGATQGTLPDQYHRALSLLERVGKIQMPACEFSKGLGTGAQMHIVVSQVGAFADEGDRETPHAPALANPGVEDGSLFARVGTDDE